MTDSAQKASSNNTVRFVLDGEVVELTDVDPTRTVLQFLREDLGSTGTKEGCAEGDCGACTVALAEIDASGERLEVRAINACIRFLPTLDGKELITVESLQPGKSALHPVQKAMLDCHGSQCGFCTPGFVMSMFALFKSNAAPSRREIDDALAGNLCRCTGYRPIVAAAEKMYESEFRLSDQSGWMYESHGEASSPDEAKKVDMLRQITRTGLLSVETDGRRYFAPTTVVELADLVATHPDATLLAGGTDIGLWVTKQHRQLDTVIYTGDVVELTSMSMSESHIDIGAAVTLTDAMPVILQQYPELEELLLRFASPPIRNAGTLGGNIANGSPIGDSMPALMVLDCEVVLRSQDGTRQLPLAGFYVDYQKTVLRRGEFLERVLIPLRNPEYQFDTYKVSKRFDQDISAVCGAYCIRLDGGKVAHVRIAYGGLAAVPKRAAAAEAVLQGGAWDEATVLSAMNALDNDFQPISDMRSSAGYRRQVCKNLLYRFWIESGGEIHRVYEYGR
jgi:xanthine dehydrogenase small subunit